MRSRSDSAGYSGDFEQARGAHAAADAHGTTTRIAPRALTLQQGVTDHTGAAHTEGVTNGDGAAVDIQLGVVDAKLIATVNHLAGKRLIQLPQVDIAHRQPVVRCASSFGTANTGPIPISSD